MPEHPAVFHRLDLCDHSAMPYNRTIRILHFTIVLSVLLQLLGETLIGLPEPNHPRHGMDTLIVGIHETIGIIALILVCTYLAMVVDEAAGRNRLFPWLSASGRSGLWSEIGRDMPDWLRGKLPPPEENHTIAGTIHGLGISLALLMGLTGMMIFLGTGPHGEMPPDIKAIWQYHSIMGTMMWVFVAGHAGMAIVHEIKGHKVLREMFKLGKSLG